MSLADEILGGSSSKQTNKSNNKNNNKNNSNKKKNNQTKISDEIFSGNYSAPKQTTTVQQKQSTPKQTVKLTGNKFLDNAIKNANNTERNEAIKQQVQALANRWNSNPDKKTVLQQVGNYVTSGDALDDATNLAKKGAMFATNKNYRNQVIKKGLNSAAVAIPQLAKGVIKTGENWYDTLQTADFLVNEGAARKLGITSEEDYQKKKQNLENKVKDDWTGNLWKYGFGWDEDVDKFLEQNSYITGSNKAGQLVESVGQQLPAMAIGQAGMDYMLGGNAANSAFQSLKGLRGAERVKAVGTNLTRAAAINSASNAEIFARSYGAATEEALQQGASLEQASKYGVLSALTEIGTEWVTSGIPGVEESTGLLSNGASKLLDKTTGKIKKEPLRRIVRNILDFTGGMAGEGFEEALSEIISPYIKNATYTHGEKVNLNDVISSFLTGAVSSGLLDFGGNVANRLTRRNANIQNNELAQQQVQQIQEQVQNGEITPQEGTQQINDIQNYLRAQESIQTEPITNETTQDNINTQEQQNVAQNANNEVEEKPKNVGKHYGDLGKAHDTNYFAMNGSRRGTGHFGTGTYFVSGDYEVGPDSTYAKRPINYSNFDDYNLARPATDQDGFDLHDALKQINYNNSPINEELYNKLLPYYEASFGTTNDLLSDESIDNYKNIRNLLEQAGVETEEFNGDSYSRYERDLEDKITDVLNNYDRFGKAEKDLKRILGVSDEQFNKAIEKVRQVKNEYNNYNDDQKLTADSLSTIFMKELGYEGVDVRHLKGLNDTEFGSVIYDLKKNNQQKQNVETTQNNQIEQQPTNQVQQELKNTKIVDEDGKPLNVFHRSNIKNIKQLEAKNGAIFFAKDGNATYYGKEKYSANLNVTNPLVIDANGENFNQIKFNQDNVKQYNSSTIENAINNIDKLTKEDVVKIAQAIDKNNSINDYIDQFKDAKDMLNSVVEAYTDGGTIEDFIKQYGRLNAYIDNNNLQTNKVTTTRDIVEYAKEKGYDGVIFKNVQDKTNGKTDVYAVFNPEQVLNMKYETQQKNNAEQQMTPKENNNIPETKTEPVVKVDLTGEKGKEYFMENGADEKVAQILSEKPKQKSNKLETAKDVAGQTYRLLVSKGGEIERISKITNRPDVKYKYDKSMRANSEAQQHIGVEQTDLNYKPYKNFTNANGEKVSMSLNDIRKDAKNNNISEQTLNEYLAHNLNVDRYMEDKPVFGKSVTSDDSLKIIAEIEQEHPEIKRIAQNVWTYEHNELKNAYDSGLISKELYDKLAKNEHYVRIQRNVDKKSSNAAILGRDGKVSVNQGIQTAKGGNQDILPIMEGIAKYTTEMVRNERINESVKSLAESMSMGSQDDTIQSIEDEESFGFNPEVFKANDDGTYTMTFFDKGKATVVPINKAIYDAYVTNKNISAAENALPTRFLTYLPKKASSMFRTLTTDKNPMFMVTNFFKDIGDAPFNSKYAKEFAKEFATTNAHRQAITNGGYNKLYNRAGGDSDSYFTEGEFKDKSQSKIGKAKDKLLFPIEKGNQIIEAGPRMAEFIATIKANGYDVNSDGEMILKDSKKANGRSAESVLDEALYNAAEITTNFKRGGDLSKAINRNGGTFFNASIQGFDKQVRNFKDAFTSGDKKKIIALLAKALIFGVAPTMLNDAMNDDDEEYKNMQDYLKDNYYLFKTGDGNYVRIPKGRAMSVIGSAYRRGKDLAGGEKDAFKGFTKFASGQVAPNNPFENNIIAPLFAVGKNESWAGNPIVSQTLEEGRPTEERYTEKTDELSKWLGKQLKNAPIPERYKTPAGINYLIDQYTGGAGDVLLPMITPKATSKTSNPLIQPFISKFTTDSVYQQKDVNEFYDVKAKLKQQKGASYATKEDKVKSSYMESRGKGLSALYAEQHEIQNDKSLSKKEKYEQAREVQKKINKFANESVKNVNDIKDHTYYATIGDDTYYLTIDKKTGKDIWSKDSYADSHKKTADKKGMALYDYYKEKYEERKAKEK